MQQLPIARERKRILILETYNSVNLINRCCSDEIKSKVEKNKQDEQLRFHMYSEILKSYGFCCCLSIDLISCFKKYNNKNNSNLKYCVLEIPGNNPFLDLLWT